MYIEIKIALNFFLSYLYDKLPRRRVNLFGEELEKYIGQKLTLANWPVTNQSNSSHTSTPPPPTTSLNESHAITLNKQELYVDSFVISAATESALDLKEIVAQMPDYLKLFIEPGLVAYLLEPPNAESTIASQLPDLKILYKLPQIDLSTLTYISGNFKESAIYQNSVTHIPEDSASTSGDLTATNSILNENLLQLLSAAATAANATTSSSPNSGVSAAPLQYFMQKLSLNEEQTSQVLSNLGQLSKQQQQQPPKVTNHGLGFPSAQFKPTLSPTDPIIQADYGSFNNRNAISPTGGTELWSSSSSSCSSSSSSTGGSSSCLSMQQPPAPSSLPTSSSSPSSKSLINNLDNTASPSLLLAAVDGSVKKPPTAMSSQPANIPVMKPPSSLFTTAEFAQTKFGSTKSKNSYYAPNKPGKSSSTAPQPHNPNHSQSSPITPQPLLSPQNSHSFHNPYHHAHHQQQKMNPEFSAYIKQKAAVQQLLKSSSVHPILGSPTSTLPTSQQPHLNGIMKPPQLSSHLSADAYLDLNLITNHLNSTNLIYDMDNSSNTSSSCSSSSTGSLTSPQHTQQQNHQAQQHQLNLLLMNLLKANSSGFDYLNSSPLFAATSSAAAAAACNFNDHHTNFDSIVNSTIKEMIDGDLDEFDETTTEETNNKLPITNSEFDENNNNNLAANLIDDE